MTGSPHSAPLATDALVIGAGAIKCAAALGVHKVLQESGIEPRLVVGCSGGSLYAAQIALGYSAEEIAQLRGLGVISGG